MILARRKVALLVLSGLALAAAGCGKSNNEGKIAGKWKLVSAPGIDEKEIKLLDGFGMAMVFDFRADGSVTAGMEATDPALRAEVEKAAQAKGEQISTSGRYKLLSGDDVEFSGFTGGKAGGGLFGKGEKGRAKVQIQGDDMTLVASDGTGKFVRMGAAPPPDGKK